MLLLQRTLIQFLAPMMGSSRPLYSVGHWHLRVYIATHTNNYMSSSKLTQGVVAGAPNQSERQEELSNVADRMDEVGRG